VPDPETTSQHASQPAEPTPGRPRFEPSYGVDPTAMDGVLPWSDLVERMTRSRNYWLCTTRPDGRPHAAPIWGLWFEGEFVFGTGNDSRKGRNLAVNPAAVVHLESGDDVVILEGVIETIPILGTDQDWLQRYTDAYSSKYDLEMDFAAMATDMSAVLYRLVPRTAFAWQERAFPATATRFTL